MRATMNKSCGICNWQTVVALTVTVLTIAACSEKPQEQPVPESAPAKLFQAQREALEKARAVELAAEKHAEEMKQQEAQQSK